MHVPRIARYLTGRTNLVSVEDRGELTDGGSFAEAGPPTPLPPTARPCGGPLGVHESDRGDLLAGVGDDRRSLVSPPHEPVGVALCLGVDGRWGWAVASEHQTVDGVVPAMPWPQARRLVVAAVGAVLPDGPVVIRTRVSGMLRRACGDFEGPLYRALGRRAVARPADDEVGQYVQRANTLAGRARNRLSACWPKRLNVPYDHIVTPPPDQDPYTVAAEGFRRQDGAIGWAYVTGAGLARSGHDFRSDRVGSQYRAALAALLHALAAYPDGAAVTVYASDHSLAAFITHLTSVGHARGQYHDELDMTYVQFCQLGNHLRRLQMTVAPTAAGGDLLRYHAAALACQAAEASPALATPTDAPADPADDHHHADGAPSATLPPTTPGADRLPSTEPLHENPPTTPDSPDWLVPVVRHTPAGVSICLTASGHWAWAVATNDNLIDGTIPPTPWPQATYVLREQITAVLPPQATIRTRLDLGLSQLWGPHTNLTHSTPAAPPGEPVDQRARDLARQAWRHLLGRWPVQLSVPYRHLITTPPTGTPFEVAADGSRLPGGALGWAWVTGTGLANNGYLYADRNSTTPDNILAAELLATINALAPYPNGSAVTLYIDNVALLGLITHITHDQRVPTTNPTIERRVGHRHFLQLTRHLRRLTVDPVWVKSRSGHPLHTHADRLARRAARTASRRLAQHAAPTPGGRLRAATTPPDGTIRP